MKAKEYAGRVTAPFDNCPDVAWLSVRKAPFTLFGLHAPADGTPFHRFAPEIGRAISPAVDNLNHHPTGGRVIFSTDSPFIAVYVKLEHLTVHPNLTLINTAGMDAYIYDEAGVQTFIGTFQPDSENKTEYMFSVNSRTRLGGVKNYLLNFPCEDRILEIYVGVSEEAYLAPAPSPYRPLKPLLFYGSSITQGCSASRPGNIYENHISRHLRMDYFNFGLSANGKAEDVIVDYMAKMDISAFIGDYDYNAPDAEYLEKTHHRMYERIRAAHPDIPYIMTSKPDLDMHPVYDRIRRDVVIRSYEQARTEGDKHVYFIDGETFFGTCDRDACMGDNVHPGDIGLYRMALVMEKVISDALSLS